MKRIYYLLFFSLFLWACSNNSADKSVEYENMSLDSLDSIQDSVEATIAKIHPGRVDSIKQLGATRDSLILVKGMILAAKKTFEATTPQYKALDNCYFETDRLAAAIDDILMKDIIETLKPTNAEFKTLVKNINDRKEALTKIAGKIKSVSLIIGTITSVITSPLLSTLLPVVNNPPAAQ